MLMEQLVLLKQKRDQEVSGAATAEGTAASSSAATEPVNKAQVRQRRRVDVCVLLCVPPNIAMFVTLCNTPQRCCRRVCDAVYTTLMLPRRRMCVAVCTTPTSPCQHVCDAVYTDG